MGAGEGPLFYLLSSWILSTFSDYLLPSDGWANKWVFTDVWLVLPCALGVVLAAAALATRAMTSGHEFPHSVSSVLTLASPHMYPPLEHRRLRDPRLWRIRSTSSTRPLRQFPLPLPHLCPFRGVPSSWATQGFSRGLADFQRSEEKYL